MSREVEMETRPKSEMPTLFVSHGAPNLVLQDLPVRAFLAQLAGFAPAPRAVLMVSAHWLSAEPTLDVSERPETIHDFQGFEAELYRVRYPAPGAPQLAGEIAVKLREAGFAARTEERGLDHGAWVPMSLAWPDASVPVTQLSLQPDLGAEHHYRLGLALRGLRERGVLVIGSGGATHNLRELSVGDLLPEWAAGFDRWLAERVEAGDAEALTQYRSRAPQARRNHPSEEHYLPLLVALGAAGERARGRTIHASASHGSLSLRAFAFA